MRNQAKYLCCLGGFIGFLSFFTISLFLGLDVLAAVIRGSVGCLFLALSFRGILHLALKSMVSSEPRGGRASQMDKLTSGNEAASSDAVEPKSETVLASAKEATAEAVSEPSPTVAEVAPA